MPRIFCDYINSCFLKRFAFSAKPFADSILKRQSIFVTLIDHLKRIRLFRRCNCKGELRSRHIKLHASAKTKKFPIDPIIILAFYKAPWKHIGARYYDLSSIRYLTKHCCFKWKDILHASHFRSFFVVWFSALLWLRPQNSK